MFRTSPEPHQARELRKSGSGMRVTDGSLEGPSTTWSSRFLTLGGFASVIGMGSLWVFASYYGLRPSELFSFLVQDGWCDPTLEGFGQHCFGDHAITRAYLNTGSIWGPGAPVPSPYPPLAMAIHIGVDSFGRIFGGQRASTILFLLLALLAISIPAVWASWRRPWPEKALVFIVLGPAALPALIVMDRAQLTAFLVPLALAFAVSISRERYVLAAAFCTVSATIKPQFILLALVFLALGKVRMLVLNVLLFALALAMSFLLWPGNRLLNLQHWFGNVAGYSNYAGGTNEYPPNMSLLQFGRTILAGLRSVGSGHVAMTESWLESHYSGVLLIVLTAIALMFWLRRSPTLNPLALLTVLLLPGMAVGTSFAYYSAVLLPIAALVVRNPSGSATVSQSGLLDVLARRHGIGKFRAWAAIILVTTFLTPVAIPSTYLHIGPIEQPVALFVHYWSVIGAFLLALFVGSLAMSSPRMPPVSRLVPDASQFE